MSAVEEGSWTPVCHLSDVDPEAGVTALVDGAAVAVFRTHDDRVFALGNYDPVAHASVLARGIVGTRTVEGEEVAYVASPLHKQGYSLATGRCLDLPGVAVPVYAVDVEPDGTIRVGPRLNVGPGPALAEVGS